MISSMHSFIASHHARQQSRAVVYSIQCISLQGFCRSFDVVFNECVLVRVGVVKSVRIFVQ